MACGGLYSRSLGIQASDKGAPSITLYRTCSHFSCAILSVQKTYKEQRCIQSFTEMISFAQDTRQENLPFFVQKALSLSSNLSIQRYRPEIVPPSLRVRQPIVSLFPHFSTLSTRLPRLLPLPLINNQNLLPIRSRLLFDHRICLCCLTLPSLTRVQPSIIQRGADNVVVAFEGIGSEVLHVFSF